MITTDYLTKTLAPYREALLNHPLYSKLNSVEAISVFMKYHAFAVWDFMSLVKALQQKLTCTDLPWVPVGNPSSRRLINEIVWGEESDVDTTGRPVSHYELYLQAMEEIGADTTAIASLVSAIQNGASWQHAVEHADIPNEIKEFVRFSLTTATQAPVHVIAGVFTYGREDLIPDLFVALVRGLANQQKSSVDTLLYYLERHIELDGDEHGPMALQMMDELCGTNAKNWDEVTEFAKQALEQRILLWDFIAKQV
ncbi:MAG: DUF3050 domain-containing protein [Bacteroidia bacterium]|nr:DUF3050 domain-containing protein [Bacteroidia bacterium]